MQTGCKDQRFLVNSNKNKSYHRVDSSTRCDGMKNGNDDAMLQLSLDQKLNDLADDLKREKYEHKKLTINLKHKKINY